MTSISWLQPSFSCVTMALFVLWLLLRVKFHVLCRTYKAGSAPRKSDWFFGFHLLFETIKEGKDGNYQEFFRKKMKKLNLRTALFKLAGKDVIFTHDPENIKAILATQFSDFCLGSRRQCFAVTLGDGIFTLDGEGWKHSRAMLRPSFSREQVGQVESLEPYVQKVISAIVRTNGNCFDVQPLFYKLTMDIGTDFLFGESCDSLEANSSPSKDPKISKGPSLSSELKEFFPEAFSYAQDMMFLRTNLQSLYWLANTRYYEKCNNAVHEFTTFYVKRALLMPENELETVSRNGYVFLNELIQETKDEIILRNQCLNILLAARDTTASLLSFTFYALSKHPSVFLKLRMAIVESFGEKENFHVARTTFESLKRCEYLKWVLNEALRMYPPVPRNFRVSTKNTTLPHGCGPLGTSPIFVEKHTPVFYSVYSLHRDEYFYGEDAHIFRPERWGESFVKKNAWAFLPFNGGPRICLGQQFALTTASYVIVRLLQTFEKIESFDADSTPRLKKHLTMSLMDGANISLR